MNCDICGGSTFNANFIHGRDGSDPELCDVCYWHKRAELAQRDTVRVDRLEQVIREHPVKFISLFCLHQECLGSPLVISHHLCSPGVQGRDLREAIDAVEVKKA